MKTNLKAAQLALFAIVFISMLDTTTASSLPAISMLHCRGSQIVDFDGTPTILRGINLGGWLVEEPWMQPFVTEPPAGSSFGEIRDHVSLWNTVQSRFGHDGMIRIRTAFRNAWIDESDFDRIKQAGFNCVRLPFLAGLADEPDGLAWLDKAIDWAGKRGIYVILDLHGAPGGQSDQDHTGQAGVNEFFKSDANIRAAEALWSQIAARYRDNPAVAGYDLVNEPMGAPNSDTLYVVMDRLYRAVRSQDQKHIVFIEDGYTGIQYMPFPVPSGWENVAYSVHHYNFDAATDTDQLKGATNEVAKVAKERDRRQIPYYIGEFGLEPNGTPATLASFIGQMDSSGISWSMWTYKLTWRRGGTSLWSLYSNAKPIEPFNFFTDSEADLTRKFDEIRTINLDNYSEMESVFQKEAASGPH